jgi:hypothetical protein
VQVPEQQSPAAAQATPTDRQAVPAQVPPAQESEQHSPLASQGWPTARQKASVVHRPPAQESEQHSSRAVQEAPPALQAGAGGVAQRWAASQ